MKNFDAVFINLSEDLYLFQPKREVLNRNLSVLLSKNQQYRQIYLNFITHFHGFKPVTNGF
ncbi:hypothetical protein ADICYQ_0133 [Cyclobacterium qasimii M12-11B]|uniref:Uncharacterized protein n=1 Tax=Cyclobacterium qasimii M12-11B TaxID=641524 RepID=S7VQP6_9BACT|nr:hypothetical protein ADICYQ_0133 [Cyclobacterium qasimii M12-11B]